MSKYDAATVEKIAMAICKSRSCEGFECCQWPSQGGRTTCHVRNGVYDDAAREVIEAMTVPHPIRLALGNGYRISGYHSPDSNGPWLIVSGSGIGKNVATVWSSRSDAEVCVEALNMSFTERLSA